MHAAPLRARCRAPCGRGFACLRQTGRRYGTSRGVSALPFRRLADAPPLRFAVISCVAAASATIAGVVACVPSGSSSPSDSGTASSAAPAATSRVKQSPNILKTVFEDNFERANATALSPGPSASAVATASGASGASPSVSAVDGAGASEPPLLVTSSLGPNWYQSRTNVWHIENGRLCGANAKNHGVWLEKPIPINARIEFDAVSDAAEGDLKAEVWGDGQSSATSVSYTNATSYLAIFGGWKNTYNVLARINEHGTDRKEIRIEKDSDDPRARPVTGGQVYHFKIERTDGRTVRWYVDGVEYLTFPDKAPLAGIGHDHFGFNDWEVKVCFDNVKVTPL